MAERIADQWRDRRYLYAGLWLLIACVVFLTLKSGNTLHYQDETEYQEIARHIADHFSVADDTGQLRLGRPPGYPAAIAAVYTVIEQPVAAKLENNVFLALAVLALVLLARRIEPGAGQLVPYLILAYPLVVYAATLLYPQVAGCLLFTLIILLMTADRFTSRHAIAA
jgi:hypothetical protein